MEPVEFIPRKEINGAYVLALLLGILGYVIFLIFGAEESHTSLTRSISMGLILAAISVATSTYKRTSLTKFICSDTDLTFSTKTGEKVTPWEDIDKVEFVYGMNGTSALKVKLYKGGKELVQIAPESFSDYGKEFLEIIFTKLEHCLKEETEKYISGEKQWKLPFIKDIIRIKGKQLEVEYPKTKRTVIPFESLRLVEIISTNFTSTFDQPHVLIDYAGGAPIKIPLNVKDIILFVFALKQIYKLECVMPKREPEVEAKLHKLRKSRSTGGLLIFISIIIIISSIFPVSKVFFEKLEENQAKEMGFKRRGEITSIVRDKVVIISYKCKKGDQYEDQTRVTKEFFKNAKPGLAIAVRVHPFIPHAYWFEGKWQFPFIWVVGLIFSLFAIALTFMIVGCVKFNNNKTIIKQLELESFATTETATPAILAENDSPTQPEPETFTTEIIANIDAEQTPDTPVEYIEAIPCEACGNHMPDEYYLTEGEKWCPHCYNGHDTTVAKGFIPFIKAFFMGSCGAVAAAAVWALVVIISNIQLGLIAILVGIIVGMAVKKGSGSGGLRYQILAIILTIYALAWAHIPIMINEIKNDPELQETFKEMYEEITNQESPFDDEQLPDSEQVADNTDNQVTETETTEPVMDVPENDDAANSDEELLQQAIAQNPSPGGGEIVLAIIILLVVGILAFIFGPLLCYLMVIIGDLFSLVFLGIALWEAWKYAGITKREFTGPFAVKEEEMDFSQAEVNEV